MAKRQDWKKATPGARRAAAQVALNGASLGRQRGARRTTTAAPTVQVQHIPAPPHVETAGQYGAGFPHVMRRTYPGR